MLKTLRVRMLHVVLLLVLMTALVAVALAAASTKATDRPVNAGVPLAAPLNEPIPAYASFQGWGQVSGGFGGSAGVSAENRFAAPAPKTAWEWNARSGWIQRSRTPGTRVYIWPYASGWSWTWTQSTGWYAMRTSELTIGFRSIAIAT